MPRNPDICCTSVHLSEQDVLAAMAEIRGYIDISPADFREIFEIAHRHALRRLQQRLSAADIMSRPALTLTPAMTLRQASALLADKGYSGAAVVDREEQVVGVVSEKDFLARLGLGATSTFMEVVARCLTDQGCLVAPLRQCTVAEIMTAPPLTAEATITVGAIADLFIERSINRLPIVDRQGRSLGIVTRTDLVRSCCITL